jgi:hypothetical protein
MRADAVREVVDAPEFGGVTTYLTDAPSASNAATRASSNSTGRQVKSYACKTKPTS